ncbi:hypothetical protein VTN77DRAFT_3852 [Rasamsonia byssochlamydoides]|uniref:uncharacterized protein n=1 Tax=Rasamsonia byssochlamydoides TaxID=89139 RepID=UPI0037427F15
MTKVKLNEDGDPIFHLIEVEPPETYPRHLTGNLKAKYDFLFTQYYQLRDLWDVQLKNHRDYWNIKAAYDFWCENGTKTIQGRQFGWSEDWLVDAIADVKEELIDLEDAGKRIKVIKAANKLTVDLLASARAARVRENGLKRIQIQEDSSSNTATEPESPSHKPHRRPSRYHDAPVKKKTNPRYNTRAGSREDPIIIGQDSDDEGGPPHRGRQRRTRPRAKDQYQRRSHSLHPSANSRVRRRRNHTTPERSHAHTHAPQTPVKPRRSRDNVRSASGSPSKKRARSRDGKDSGRARKSPKRNVDGNAGSSSSDKSSPGSASPGSASRSSSSSGDGGCLLVDEERT